MIIGVPKEVKVQESRVALTPDGAKMLVSLGHTVFVENGAGVLSGFSDEEYLNAGAKITDARGAWNAELVIKVKEPVKKEFCHFRKGLILFTYLHLAPNKPLTRKLLSFRVTAIDYSTVQLPDGSFPLLRPMSEITGKLAIRKAAQIREKKSGLLLGGTSKFPPEHVLIIGGGNVGVNAAEEALAMDARVTVIDLNPKRVSWLREHLRHFIKPQSLYSAIRYQQVVCEIQNAKMLENLLPHCDIVIGAALIPGAETPHIVTEEMVKTMKKGSVIIDVSIDQGGCFETSRPTNHNRPTFTKYGIIHYCVTNMPALVPRTSTMALTKETFSYILELANKGLERAMLDNHALAKGINIHEGKITNQSISKNFGKYKPPEVRT